jgi:hypothetical protein
VERVREGAARTPVEAANVAEVTGLLEILFYEPHVPVVIQLAPDLDRLGGKTAISMLLHPTTSIRSGSV